MAGSVVRNPSRRELVELHCPGLCQWLAYKQKNSSIFCPLSQLLIARWRSINGVSLTAIEYVREQYMSPRKKSRNSTG